MNAKKTKFERLIEKANNYPAITIILIIGSIILYADKIIEASNKIYAQLSPEPSIPLVRFKYYTLEGDALSLLLYGELDKGLKETNNKNPLILQNTVYNYLLNLHNKLAYVRYGDVEIEHNFNGTISTTSGLFNTHKLCPGSYSDSDGREIPNEGLVDINFLQEDGWMSQLSKDSEEEDDYKTFTGNLKNGKIKAGQVTFYKYISRKELLTFFKNSREKSYYDWLTKDGAPSNFLLARVYYDPCGGYRIELLPYGLKLRILIIENTTTHPILLNKLEMDADLEEKLRSNFILRDKVKAEKVVPGGIMAPSESLVIPLYLFISNDPGPYRNRLWHDDFALNMPIPSMRSLVKKYKSLQLFEKAEPVILKLDTEKFLKSIELFRESNIKSEYIGPFLNYYLGPYLQPRSINTNKRSTIMNPIESASIIVSHGYSGASCPRIYIASDNGPARYYEKAIIGYDRPEKKGWCYIDLPRNTKKVLLKETDPEISFIDCAYLKVSYSEDQKLIYPETKALNALDGESINLKRNEEHELFDNLRLTAASSVKLCINGYYEQE